MRTTLVLIGVLILTTGLFAQNLDNSTAVDSILLSRQEVELLNSLLKNERDTFNFQEKKIAFITGSSGYKIVTKAHFLDTCVRPWTTKGSKPQIFMVRLTQEEKKRSSGYDAIVLSWVKLFTEKQRKKTVNKLGSR